MKRGSYEYSDFGKQTKIRMISLGLSNRELANYLGYTESTVCDILKGRNQSEHRIHEISELLSRLEIGSK